MSEYTVISFAPVQGFIEKSRKLRDLYGASQILSYLSWKIVKAANNRDCTVISPALDENNLHTDIANADIVQGMPNRILIKGIFSYNDAHQALMEGWKEIIYACRQWLDSKLEIDDASWINSWTRWKIHAWELFCGTGETIKTAMLDLETRKLRRDWTVPNWNGESSSLSGADAIAHPMMDNLGTRDTEIKEFYKCLAQALDSSKENDFAYINENERLSIPELIKRLISYPDVSRSLDRNKIIKRNDSKRVFDLGRVINYLD